MVVGALDSDFATAALGALNRYIFAEDALKLINKVRVYLGVLLVIVCCAKHGCLVELASKKLHLAY